MNNKQQFEAWYLENWGCTEDNHDSLFEESPHGGEYYRFGVRLAWQAWQAASKASEQQLAALAAENAGLKDSVEHAAGCIHAAEVEGLIDALGEKDGERLADLIHRRLCHAYLPVETPATDAYQAEVRAQGVDMYAERKNNEMMSLHPDTHAVGSIAAAMSAEVKELREFAAQLRQGGAQ